MSAREIVAALSGRWFGYYGVVRCVVHEDRRPSLKLRDGDRGLLVHCYAGCDPLDVLAEMRRRGLLPGDAGETNELRLAETAKRRREDELRDRRKREDIARAIWRAAKPAAGTLVEVYLQTRGIDKILTPSLRWHPALAYERSGLKFPAMVAAVQAPDRHISGVHRTFLMADGRGKAQVSDPKMSLGTIAGGAVRLAGARDELAIGEGIETCLSYQQAERIPAWAALSTSGLRAVILPPPPLAAVVHVLVDADAAGERAAQEAALRFSREGRRVILARPKAGKDMNDALREAAHA